MKFVVEALGLTAGGGKGIVSELLPALATHQEHEFVAILPRVPEYGSMGAPNLKIMEFEKPRGLLRRALFLHRTVPEICRAEHADALLCLGNFAPRRLPIPALISLRNAFFVSPSPEACGGLSLRERLIVRYARWHFRRLPEDIFLTVETELMREQFLNAYPVEPSRVAVISNGAGRLPRIDAGEAARARKPEDPFTFLCLARYYPHKNIEVCVEAIKGLVSTGRRARLLLTVDAGDHRRACRLLQRVRQEGLEEWVQSLGTVRRSELPRIFASADALLLPTLLESFSRTFLEAMSYELPILTSDRDFARRICGGAALYFDPLHAESVAGAMAQIMENAALRRDLVARGFKEAARFPDWDEIAAQFVTALESVATGRGLQIASRQILVGAMNS
ncbi:MAG: glycosyltransferase [Terriglobia bacterium]